MTDYIHDRKIAIKALVGSHNYGIQDENSDLDYKYFVFPTWEDMYKGKKFTVSINSENIDYTVHDIRDLSKFLCKANISFLEVLFSKELTGDQEILDLFCPIKEMFIVKNYGAFYKGCLGIFENKMKKFERSYKEGQPEWKEASNACRALLTLKRYVMEYETFEKAFKLDINREIDEDFRELKRIRKGEWDYSVIELFTSALFRKAQEWNTPEIEDKVLARLNWSIWNSYEFLDEALSKIIYDHIKKAPI